MTNSKYSNDLPRAVQNGMSQAEYDTWMFLADKRGLDEEYTYAIKQSDLTKFLREYRTNTIKSAIEVMPKLNSNIDYYEGDSDYKHGNLHGMYEYRDHATTNLKALIGGDK